MTIPIIYQLKNRIGNLYRNQQNQWNPIPHVVSIPLFSLLVSSLRLLFFTLPFANIFFQTVQIITNKMRIKGIHIVLLSPRTGAQ